MARKKVDLKVIDPKEETKTAPPARGRGFGSGGRPMWSGSISFGLVNIPVKVISGIRHKDLRFHLLHEKDNARLKRRYICPVEDKEVPPEEIKKGYEISPNQHVIMEEDELEKLAPKASRAIELMYFIHTTDVDPVYFETPYYLIPDENAVKAYGLLRDAMAQSNRAALTEIVMRNKEYMAIVRPAGQVLALDTMRFPDEIVFPQDVPWKAPAVKIQEREMKAARDLIDSLAAPFKPEKLRDDYRAMVLKAIERKAKGHKIVATPVAEAEEAQVIDLMAALEKSLQRAPSKKLKATA